MEEYFPERAARRRALVLALQLYHELPPGTNKGAALDMSRDLWTASLGGSWWNWREFQFAGCQLDAISTFMYTMPEDDMAFTYDMEI